MAVFTVMSIIGAAIAVVMKDRAKQIYVTCGVLFSSGVLLAGGFVHLLGDSNEQFTDLGIDNFPWAFFVSGSTILGLTCIEMVLDRAMEGCTKKKEVKAQTNDDLSTATGLEDGALAAPLIVADHTNIHPDNPFSAVLLTIAISIHVVLEGLGIGATQDIGDLQAAFIAVAVHKAFVAFALAENVVSSGYWEDKTQRKYFYLSLGTFIILSILGIGIGWAISSSGDGLVAAVLIGITSGSFIYVSVVEILPQETKNIKREHLAVMPPIISFLLGYGLMSVLALWA